jgi:hypothetical protein
MSYRLWASLLLVVFAIAAVWACDTAEAPTPTPSPSPTATNSQQAADLALTACLADLDEAGYQGDAEDVYGDAAGDAATRQTRDYMPHQEFEMTPSPADTANGIEWVGTIRVTFIERSRAPGGDWGDWADAYRIIPLRKQDGVWERGLTPIPITAETRWTGADAPVTTENSSRPQRVGCTPA